MSGGDGSIAQRSMRRWPAFALPSAAVPLRVVAALAWPGFVAGHVLTFGRPHGDAAGDGGVDVHLLDVGVYGQLLAVLAGLMLTGVLVQSGRRALRDDDWRPARVAMLAAATQVALFALIEVAERGWSITATLADPSVAVGVAVQLAVAAAMVALLTATTEAVRAVVQPPAGRRVVPAAALPHWRVAREAVCGSAAILQRAAPRAPPACSG